jgi:hypothetical protein
VTGGVTVGFGAGAGGVVVAAGTRAGAICVTATCGCADAGASVVAGAGFVFGFGFVATGAGGVTRWITIGFGRAGSWTCAVCTTGATTIAAAGAWNVGFGKRGSVCARTIAGCDAAAGRANEGVCPVSDPARMRGNATTPATAPASRTAATTPLVIALMVPTPNADGITRSRYRQVGTRA